MTRPFLAVVFSLLALACAPLSLAAFAGVNPGAPSLLRLLSAVEATLAARVSLQGVDPFWRGLTELALSALFVWLAVYLWPRRRAVRAAQTEETAEVAPRKNPYGRHG